MNDMTNNPVFDLLCKVIGHLMVEHNQTHLHISLEDMQRHADQGFHLKVKGNPLIGIDAELTFNHAPSEGIDTSDIAGLINDLDLQQ